MAIFCYTGTSGTTGRKWLWDIQKKKLNSLDKETIIQLFLAQQEQLRQIDQNLQLVLEQLADQKRRRFGRSSEKHETEGQIAFMEVDGTIVFFNEAEAVAAESADDSLEEVPRQRPKKKRGKREEDLKGLPVIVVEHSMEEKELEQRFGQGGWKQLPDEIYRRYRFTPAKVEVEEHHVKVYAGKKTEEVVKAPHPGYLLKGSLVSPSLEAAVMNAKYVNAVPALPAGAGVRAVRPAYFQTEHGELDDPVRGEVSCGAL